MTGAERRADELVERLVAQADTLTLGAYGRSRVLEALEAADADLRRRLRRLIGAGMDESFSAARVRSYLAQVRLALERLRPELVGALREQTSAATTAGARRAARALSALERLFEGVAPPLEMLQAVQLDSVCERVDGSLLSRHLASIDRYGAAMVRVFEGQLMAGVLSGASQRQMAQRLAGTREVPGLFRREEYWARRIVRTEVAAAQNAAHDEYLLSAAQRSGRPLKRKIVATFDNRTASDSVYVHGQIRALGEPFMDGHGRVYLRPPGRPNDREVLVPWRDEWPELPSTRPRAPDEVGRAVSGSAPDYLDRDAAQRRASVDIVAAQVRAEVARQRQERALARERMKSAGP